MSTRSTGRKVPTPPQLDIPARPPLSSPGKEEESIKKKVLIIEGAAHVRYEPDPRKNIGGSSVSLSSLVTNLDECLYVPTALFYYPSLIAEKLKDRGYQVLTSKSRFKRPKRRSVTLPLISPKQRGALSYYKLCFLKIWPESLRLARLFREVRPDLVHCNMSLLSDLAAVIASRLSRIPCVCHVRDFGRIYGIHRLCSRSVAFFICISEAIRQNYLRQGIREAQLALVYNALDLEDFRTDSGSPRPKDNFTVTQIGRLIGWKGQRVLLQAAPLVLKKIPRVQFAFAGDGPDRIVLERLAAELHIGSWVSFLGVVGDVRPLLAASDVIVLPSLSPEPFGRVVIEAMAMEKPVIATDLGGPKEIITPLVDGLLVKPDDPVLLAEKIVALIENREAARKLGRRARKTVAARFDARRAVREIEEIYERATAGR